MSTWLIVRDTDNVDAAYKQAMEMLDWIRQQKGLTSVDAIEGIWVDPGMAAQPPIVMSARDSSGREMRLRIVETTGLQGIWLLCRIESDEPGQEFDRADILDAFLSATAEALNLPFERVMPVSSTLVPASEMHAVGTEIEWAAKKREHSR